MSERFKKTLEQRGNLGDLKRANRIPQRLRERRGRDVSFPVESQPAIDLQLEWNKQSQKLASLFAQELGYKTEGEYIASLPKFESQPEQFKGRFDIPVIVETRLPLDKMLGKAGISVYFDTKEIKDWDENRFKTPKLPYTAWLADGRRNLKKPVRDVRKNLASDERGGTLYDGIALYLRKPNILRDNFLNFPGSKVGSGIFPCLRLRDGRPEVDDDWVGGTSPRFGCVVAGKL